MKNRSPIIPGNLTKTAEEFSKRLDFACQYVDSIHIDVADGKFVDVESLPIAEWPKIEIGYAEAHLMVQKPVLFLSELKAAGIMRAIIHIESYFDLDELVEEAKANDILLGFAVSPDTDLEYLKPFFEVSNYIQVMGIVPGKTGQKMLDQTHLAVSYLRRLPSRRLTLTVDGGVHLEQIEPLIKSGANFLVSSSGIYDRGDWEKNYVKLMKKVDDVS